MFQKCFLSPAADNDVDEIITYLADENPKSARAFLDALFKAFQSLSENPDLGHKREDLTDHPVKLWPFKWHYLIIYKPVIPIEIVRVLSGHRDIIEILR